MTGHYLNCPTGCTLEHQPRERTTKCVGYHPARKRPSTLNLSGLCDACEALKASDDERRAALEEERRERAAQAAYGERDFDGTLR